MSQSNYIFYLYQNMYITHLEKSHEWAEYKIIKMDWVRQNNYQQIINFQISLLCMANSYSSEFSIGRSTSESQFSIWYKDAQLCLCYEFHVHKSHFEINFLFSKQTKNCTKLMVWVHRLMSIYNLLFSPQIEP